MQCTEFRGTIYPATDLGQLYQILREYVIVHNPPYNIKALISGWSCERGRTICITVYHNSRNVTIAQPDDRASACVLRTVVPVFERLPIEPTRRVSLPRRVPKPCARQRRGRAQECRICFDAIDEEELQVLPCAHVYHRACIARWFEESRSCPQCRLAL